MLDGMADEIQDQILNDAQKPAAMAGDNQSVTKRPLSELIAADQYLRGSTGARKAHRGMRITKVVPPGAD